MSEIEVDKALELVQQAKRLVFEKGDPGGALPLLNESLPLLHRLVFHEQRYLLLVELARAEGVLIVVLCQLGRVEEAFARCEAEVARLWTYIEHGAAEVREPLAESCNALGGLCLQQGDYARAHQMLDEAIRLLEPKVKPDPQPTSLSGDMCHIHYFEAIDPRLEKGELARAYYLKGLVYLHQGDLPQSDGYLDRSIGQLAPLAVEPSPDSNFQDLAKEQLARCYTKKGQLLSLLHRGHEALSLYRQALDLIGGREDVMARELRNQILNQTQTVLITL